MDEEQKKRLDKQLARYKGVNGKLKVLTHDDLWDMVMPVISLKEGKSGKYEIKKERKKAGEVMMVVSPRNWLMMGYKQTSVELPFDRDIHKLVRNGDQLLMSDTPQEAFLQYEAYQSAKGRVLVGGLGLGVIATWMAKKPEVKEITVVEISKDVIKLSKPKHPKIHVVQADIWDYLKTTKEQFDFIYIDIHYRTGHGEYIETVLPMREILKQRFPGVPATFWGEAEMESQHEWNDWAKERFKQRMKQLGIEVSKDAKNGKSKKTALYTYKS